MNDKWTHTDHQGAAVSHPPRLAPLEGGKLTGEARQLLLLMLNLGGTVSGARERGEAIGYKPTESGLLHEDLTPLLETMPAAVRMMLHHPRLFAPLVEFGIQLNTAGAIPPRERELAILRIAWLCQAPFEWGEHVLIARKLGIDSEGIERITEGSQAPGWSNHEQAILRATEELFTQAAISDATWEQLSGTYNNQQLIELPVIVGQYQAVAYSQNSLRLQLAPGNLGLAMR